ncbi:nuclear factor, interleukin 3 regulated, member 6 isoform X2 [Denticeps clupeoides]|uniref:BZIP domain-containing protein n=2 Tax=Denticeps clupeoides TaxID=299321 RepID=A0AAY4CEY4_9TELE|nr:uncharacterized protein LOC114794179 isoform X2 [Denticeps clupeoides]XP_028842403.1 uncharacterized protein LOC114794179 isoform X2 [Denticeps clupeoides]
MSFSNKSLFEEDSLEVASAGQDVSFADEAVSILTSSSLLARSLLGRASGLKRKEESGAAGQSSALRRKREFIPHEKKDDGYWDKRKKNNEAAKRSREKRRVNDMVLENRLLALLEENARLRAELLALKFRFGLVKDPSNAPILPLSAQNPVTPQYYLPGAQPSHPCPGQGTHLQGSRRAGGLVRTDASSPSSEDSGFSTPGGGSSVGSPVFFDDRGEHCGKEELAYEAHHSPAGHQVSTAHRPENGDGMRSLPHKLRFKLPGGGDGHIERCGPAQPPPSAWGQHFVTGTADGSVPPQEGEDSRHHFSPPGSGYRQCQSDPLYHAENSVLKSQLSSLSAEVSQLKRLFTEQLLPKAN